MASTKINSRKFKLKQPGKIGVDCHVKALHKRYPAGATLDELVRYIDAQGHMKPQSMAVLAYNLKSLVKDSLGEVRYQTELPTKFAVDSAFKKYSLGKYRTQYRVDDVPSVENVEYLIKNAGLKTGLISAFLYISAMRVSEMCNLKIKDLVPEKECYRLRIVQKGGSRNDPIVHQKLIDQVRLVFKGKEYLFETRDGNQYNRKTVSSMIRAEADRLLGKRITAHTLRHAFATHMIQSNRADIAAIARQMGHSSPSTTLKMYVHSRLSPDQLPDASVI